jgi:hypothetical protein
MIFNRQDAKAAKKGYFSMTKNLAFSASWRLNFFLLGILRVYTAGIAAGAEKNVFKQNPSAIAVVKSE